MYIEDARCKVCDNVYTIYKEKITDDWISGFCPECGSTNTMRIYSACNFDVGAGKCGHTKTGYQSEIVYKPSVYGRFKGKKIL